ncbi:MAG: 5'-nucleotidase C-terminal domain-containing protein [Candidatus Sericytochromatia bacterium]|nr:5'-nucleotidase C-terminal domain-containing protein [Candidatus Sericytochromatia bacterium]
MLSRLLGSVLGALLFIPASSGFAAWAAPKTLTILHTNDTHAHLETFDSRGRKDVGGMARRASLFQRIKQAESAVLVLDAGDVFQGTPLFNFFSGEPDFITMQQAGYDAIAVGNHDLDNGIGNLLLQAKHLKEPPISANLMGPSGKAFFPSHRIFERGGLKIAVIGAIGLNAFEAVAEGKRANLVFRDPKTEIEKVVQSVRPHVDLVVLLTHIGHEEEIALARALPDVDLIVGGHSHTKVSKPKVVEHPHRHTLVAQAFQWGEYVGRIDLQVDNRRIVAHRGKLIPVSSDIPQDPEIAKTIEAYSEQIAVQMREVLGTSNLEFRNSRKREGDTPIGNLIADAVRHETGTQVAFMNSGGIRAPLPKGSITLGMVYSMLPFENTLVSFDCTGEDLQSILDFAASRHGKSGSLQVSGLSYTVAGGHATDVRVSGTPLIPTRRYSVATIDYVAQGNDGADVFRRLKNLKNTGVLVRDAFKRYLRERKVLTLPAGGRIKTAPPIPSSVAP